ncbi:hypothetical protein [Ancylobacter mangrovi]|uniref:DUF3035 domain-containing protein n=1 Tax=Ancylobacter mangrovi TaxID=2972472 RepID=A0A9X2PFF1_9HYPH|nr:hypothetical protein [Ancylobacter mangrovi]MCS0495000.1 hypothetical protein [Ancylobacter mangrovi]MCS0502394.1 hypothetical protein [Ancylobacter mangrovi]
MMKRPLSTRAALLGGALGVALAMAGTPASAQEQSFTEQLFTSFGLVAPTPPEIDYRERAPLVVPPADDVLPPPRNANALSQNPAWPKDVDVQRRKAELQAARTPVNFSDRDATRALTPAEVARGTNPNSTYRGAMMKNNAERPDWLKPTEGLGFLGWDKKQKEKPMVFQGEPERTSLTEPPPGFQTPAEGAAYGVVAERPDEKEWKLPNWFDRTQSNNDRH